jgi:hypothetical protein
MNFSIFSAGKGGLLESASRSLRDAMLDHAAAGFAPHLTFALKFMRQVGMGTCSQNALSQRLGSRWPEVSCGSFPGFAAELKGQEVQARDHTCITTLIQLLKTRPCRVRVLRWKPRRTHEEPTQCRTNHQHPWRDRRVSKGALFSNTSSQPRREVEGLWLRAAVKRRQPEANEGLKIKGLPISAP